MGITKSKALRNQPESALPRVRRRAERNRCVTLARRMGVEIERGMDYNG